MIISFLVLCDFSVNLLVTAKLVLIISPLRGSAVIGDPLGYIKIIAPRFKLMKIEVFSENLKG